MRQLLLISFLTSSFHYGFSQRTASEVQARYDSLHRALSVVKEDTNKVKIWNQLANYHKFGRADSGIFYATKALSLSRSLGYVSQEPTALNFLALSYSTLDNHAAAIRVSLEQLRISERSGDTDDVAHAWLGLGVNYFQFGNYTASIEFYKRAYSLFEYNHDNNFTATSSAYLSRSFFAQGQMDSALLYGYKSKQIAEVDNVPWVLANAYQELAKLRRGSASIDSALYYFRKSHKLSLRSPSRRSHRGLELAKLFRTIGKIDSCTFYANDALKTAQDNNLYPDMREVSLFFAELYEKENPSKALQFSKQALASSDSLTKMSNMSAYTDFIDYDEQQRQYELATAEKEYQSRIRTNTLLGSTFTLVVIAFFLYRNNMQKQKAKQKIENAYDQLKSTQTQLIQSEKMASLGELTAGIAHEIQNPLNFVNNFSEVNKELIGEMKQEIKKGNLEEVDLIANDIEGNEEKINHHGKRADAIVKGMLQHSRTGSGQKEPTDINALCDEYLRLSYHGYRAKDKTFNAKFETHFDSTLEKINVVPQDIGRVILNLINNAFYAVNEMRKGDISGYEPTVSIATKRVNNKIQITVKDNGNGIPENIKDKIFQPFFTTKPTGQGTGLGLSLSYDIVKAHGGELRVETKQGEGLPAVEAGSEFTIQLPIV